LAIAVWAAPLAAQNQPPTLPETRVEATPPVTEFVPQEDTSGLTGTILDGTILSNAPAEGYRAPTSTTGSIIAIPDADLPGTVNSITRDVLNDQITLSIQDVIRNAPGVVPAGDTLFADKIFIRGLEVGSRNYRKDGFFDPTFVPRDWQNVERVEILKGPASFLYGSGDPAGIVNVITKKPIANNPFATGGFTFGAYGQQRYTLDANGSVNQSGTVLYRLNVAQEDRNSFVDFDYLNRTQVAPVVTWLIDPSTTLTWNGEWHKHHTLGFQGTPAVNGDPLFLPPSRFVGQPNDFLRTEEFRQSLVLTRELADDWIFTLGGYSLFYQFPGRVTSALSPLPPGPLFPGTAPFARGVNEILREDEQSHSMIANLAGDFYLGDFRHRAVAGMEYVYFGSNSAFNFNAIGVPTGFPPPNNVFPISFDVANPNYAGPLPTVPLLIAQFPLFQQQRVGGYVQDLVDITPTIKAIGGVRFDTLTETFDRTLGGFPLPRSQQTFDHVTPRGGIVYQPYADESLAFYYNYSQSFTPPGGGVFASVQTLQPIIGQGHEAGIKTELLPNLTLNAAGYNIERKNDIFNPSSFIVTQVGEVRSQGAELALLGDITDRWTAIANYTYSDSRLFDANLGFNGQNTRNVPFNSANFWTRYNVLQDEVSTAGAALGLVYLGERPADLANTLNLPSFARWDAGLYYSRGPLNAYVYVENLFDLQYAYYSVNSLQIYQGAPLNARASIWWTF
jgi:iron complex outermembrane receptor protein